MRKCPSCDQQVSLWRIIKPGLFDSTHKHEVVCQKCDHVISRTWADIGVWVLLFELVIPLVLWPMNIPLKLLIIILVVFFIASIVLAYLLIPFKDHGKKDSIS